MVMKRIAAFLTGLVLSLSLALAVLAMLIDGLGGSAPLMQVLMERHAPPETTGLSEEHYAPMAEMVTDYLSGRESTFQYTVEETQQFQPHEQQHMADCKQLFDLDRLVLLAASALAVLSGCVTYGLRSCKRQLAYGARTGCLLVLLMVALLALWGALDFDSLFILFHRISFTNNLWLLNPGTDLLIRLMPTDFFIHYAVILCITWLAVLLLMTFSAFYFLRISKR